MIQNSDNENTENQNQENLDEDLKETREKFQKGLNEAKGLFDTALNFGKDALDTVLGEEGAKKIKDFTNTVEDKFNNVKEKISTETITPDEFNDDSYVCNIGLPGVPKEQIKADLQDNKLIIQIDKSNLPNGSRENWSVKKSRLALDFDGVNDVDTDNINISNKNGLLIITIPKIIQEEKDDKDNSDGDSIIID